MKTSIRALGLLAGCFVAFSAYADPFFFSTGNPDGLIATGSRPASNSKIEIESADDFILAKNTRIDHLTFTGLIPGGASISKVRVEIYRVFPKDSKDPPSGHVPTRRNSPSDVVFTDRDSSLSQLSFTTTVLNPNFTAANSVLNGIHKIPNVFTGGEGPVSGNEVRFDIKLLSSFLLGPDHYFFIPQVELDTGEFMWLSAPKPIVPPGTAFTPDLQSWIRNADLDPDWLRIGTDITHQGPFNAVFSLSGQTVPEPASLALLGVGLLGIVAARKRKSTRA